MPFIAAVAGVSGGIAFVLIVIVRSEAVRSAAAMRRSRGEHVEAADYVSLNSWDLMACACAAVCCGLLSAASRDPVLPPAAALLVGFPAAFAFTVYLRFTTGLRNRWAPDMYGEGYLVRASRWVEQPWPTWRQASARFRVLVVCLAVVAFAADFASAALIVSERGILVFVVVAAALTFGLPLWSALVRAREESLTSHT